MFHQSRWTVAKLNRRLSWLESFVYRSQVELELFEYAEVSPDADFTAVRGVPLPPGSHWGRGKVHFVLRTRFRVPAQWRGPAALFLPLGEPGDFSHPEALVYVDGKPVGACDRHHHELLLDEALADGKEHELVLHGWTGTGLDQDTHVAIAHPRLLMKPCYVAELDSAARRFLTRVRVAVGVAESLEEHDPAHSRLLNALDEAMLMIHDRKDLLAAEKHLDEGIRKAGPPLDVTLVATGHAHIDVAWLWRLEETRRKAARTFHNVLALMDQYPRFHFTQSQPQLYEYVRQDHPELFERVQKRVAEGRWEVIGGMWVEADANLSGGEALVRQFLLGRDYFARHFGPEAETPVLWLPDVFGYPACLPQLIKGAGLDYFFTIKIGWSQYNRVPHDTFLWEGLDGTRVLTHFSTAPDLAGVHASTYNAFATPKQVLGTWRTLRNKELQSRVLMAFGHGDGGGGPTREMIENLEEMAHFPSTPKVRMGSVKRFFRELEAEVGSRIPVWNGELYLELHRGTYTSQSRSKRANRKSEQLLHTAEFLCTRAGVSVPELRTAWELLCLHQFHDILPGSSIGEVYQDSMVDYARIRSIAEDARKRALAAVPVGVGGSSPEERVVINPTSFHRREVCGDSFVEAPPYSISRFTALPAPESVTVSERGQGYRLENGLVRVDVAADGELTSLWDKVRRREALAGRGNQLCFFEDRPLNWEAWDVDIFFDEKMRKATCTGMRILEQSGLRGAIEASFALGETRLVQRIVLCADSPRVDFETQVDWRERQTLLKVAFPVDVRAPLASHEIQWGYVQRATHRNTSWDWARFETCAHKWIDLSEDDFGVSLLNDCKYGHDVRDNVMRISLLRAPLAPDPQADQGDHEFTYSVMVHGTGLDETVAQAYALNYPLEIASGAPSAGSYLATDTPSVIIETIKPAEDGRGVICRLFQSQRRRSRIKLLPGFEVKESWRCNLIERDLQETGLELELGPFEIATLRLIPVS